MSMTNTTDGSHRSEIVQGLYRETAALFGCDVSEIASRCRTQSVARARMVAIGTARARYGWSYPELGRAFGRDHTTCIHAVRWAREHGYILDLQAAAE
jgi:chromosomal replication initiator protein